MANFMTPAGYDQPDSIPRQGMFSGALIVLGFIISCIPIVWVAAPPIMDFPNHLARIWLLAGGATQPPLSGMYIVDWSRAAINIGVDWGAAQLGHVLSFGAVDRILRLLMFLGPPAGAVCLSRVIFGRYSVWQLAPLALAWSTTSIAGFLNYSVGLGAALFAASFVLHRKARLDAITLGVHVVLSAILMVIHPFGLAFYIVLITGIVIGPRLGVLLDRGQILSLGKTIAVFIALSALPAFLLLHSAPNMPGSGHIGFGSMADRLNPKLNVLMLLSPILTYKASLDVLLSLPVLLVVIAAKVTGRIAVHMGLLCVAGALLIMCFFMPESIGDASWVQRRLPNMVALICLSAIMPSWPNVRGQYAMAAVLLLAVTARTGWIAHIWIDRDQDLTDLYAVTEKVAPGSAMVVVVQSSSPKTAPFGRYLVGAPFGTRPVRRHLASLLVPHRQVFIPTLFAIPGQQPLRIAPQWQRDAVQTSSMPRPAQLDLGSRSDNYLTRWRCDFQYVLLTGADEQAGEPLPEKHLHLVATQGYASLYAIEPAVQGEPCGPPVPPS